MNLHQPFIVPPPLAVATLVLRDGAQIRLRRYGKPGMEFLEQSIYNYVGGVWQPENPAERMVTVRLA